MPLDQTRNSGTAGLQAPAASADLCDAEIAERDAHIIRDSKILGKALRCRGYHTSAVLAFYLGAGYSLSSTLSFANAISDIRRPIDDRPIRGLLAEGKSIEEIALAACGSLDGHASEDA